MQTMIAPSYTHITTNQAEINLVPNVNGSRAATLPNMGSIDTCTGPHIDDQTTGILLALLMAMNPNPIETLLRVSETSIRLAKSSSKTLDPHMVLSLASGMNIGKGEAALSIVLEWRYLYCFMASELPIAKFKGRLRPTKEKTSLLLLLSLHWLGYHLQLHILDMESYRRFY